MASRSTRDDVYLTAAKEYVAAHAAIAKISEPHGGYLEGNAHSLANDPRFRAAVDGVLEWVRRDEMGT